MVAEVVHYRRFRRTEVQILEVRGNVDEEMWKANMITGMIADRRSMKRRSPCVRGRWSSKVRIIAGS